MKSKLRLAVAALTENVYVGRVNKAGDTFLDGKQDVTNDFLKAVIDRFGGKQSTIRSSDGDLWELVMKKKSPQAQRPGGGND